MSSGAQRLAFRPFDGDAGQVPLRYKYLRHTAFAWLGLRPVFAQHTAAEHKALMHWAGGRKQLVEIGVAEGASAAGLREAMSPDGVLTLIDPYHLSRVRTLNTMLRAAHAVVERCPNGRVVWLERFSHEAVADWRGYIDFLFIDGDHGERAVREDWADWSPFVATSGVVAFHDARVFPGGWTRREDGPVRFVDTTFRGNAADNWRIAEETDSLVVVQRS